jgi:hypothetical protein
MNAIRWAGIGVTLAALVAGAACGGGDSTGPKAGTATISLVTPNADDGAVLLTLTVPGLANVQSASSSYRVYWRVVSPSEVRAIVVGNLASGAVLTASVDDVGKVGQYAGTVVEAASLTDVVRGSTAGYGVTFKAQ